MERPHAQLHDRAASARFFNVAALLEEDGPEATYATVSSPARRRSGNTTSLKDLAGRSTGSRLQRGTSFLSMPPAASTSSAAASAAAAAAVVSTPSSPQLSDASPVITPTPTFGVDGGSGGAGSGKLVIAVTTDRDGDGEVEEQDGEGDDAAVASTPGIGLGLGLTGNGDSGSASGYNSSSCSTSSNGDVRITSSGGGGGLQTRKSQPQLHSNGMGGRRGSNTGSGAWPAGLSKQQLQQLQQPRVPWWIQTPDSRFRRVWEIIIVLPVVFVSYEIPYTLCFNVHPTGWLFALEALCYAVFVCDLILRFTFAPLRADGTLETQPRRIAWRYATSWFFVDLAAALPLQYALDSHDGSNDSGIESRLTMVLRLLRLLQMVKLLRLGTSRASVVLQAVDTRLHPAFSKVFQILAVATFALHLCACAWWAVAEANAGVRTTWVDVDAYVTLEDRGSVQAYVSSLHYATSVFIALGMGDIAPRNVYERMFTIVATAVGLFWGALVVSQMASMVSAADRSHAEITAKVTALQDFAAAVHLPRALTQRILSHYQHADDLRRVNRANHKALLEDLPAALRQEVVLVTNAQLIAALPAIARQPHDVQAYLVENLRQQHAVPGEFIALENTVGDCMFFLKKGRVRVSNGGDEICTYGSGSLMGEADCLFSPVRIASIQAVTACELYSLSRDRLVAACSDFPAFGAQLRSVAVARLRRYGEVLGEPLVGEDFLRAVESTVPGASAAAAAANHHQQHQQRQQQHAYPSHHSEELGAKLELAQQQQQQQQAGQSESEGAQQQQLQMQQLQAAPHLQTPDSTSEQELDIGEFTETEVKAAILLLRALQAAGDGRFLSAIVAQGGPTFTPRAATSAASPPTATPTAAATVTASETTAVAAAPWRSTEVPPSPTHTTGTASGSGGGSGGGSSPGDAPFDPSAGSAPRPHMVIKGSRRMSMIPVPNLLGPGGSITGTGTGTGAATAGASVTGGSASAPASLSPGAAFSVDFLGGRIGRTNAAAAAAAAVGVDAMADGAGDDGYAGIGGGSGGAGGGGGGAGGAGDGSSTARSGGGTSDTDGEGTDAANSVRGSMRSRGRRGSVIAWLGDKLSGGHGHGDGGPSS